MERSDRSAAIAFLRDGKVLLLALAWFMAAATVRAQDVGSVVVVDGAAEIGRNGAWAVAAAGAAVQAGDELRTGAPGRMRIIFQDDSLLDLGPGAQLSIDEQVFVPASATFRTRLRLLQGKLRALVSEYYKDRHGLYEIETPTAVAGVRGTEFLITYDPVADTTEIVGVSGRVQVNSVMDRVGRKVFVTSREVTMIQRGEFPSPPKRMDESTFRQYLEGITLSRVPRPQTLAAVQQPVLAGAAVPASERAVVPPPSTGGAATTASSSTTATTAQTSESQAPQAIEVHTTELQATSPQGTGSTAGTIQTAQQITSVQTTGAQSGRGQAGGVQPSTGQAAETQAGGPQPAMAPAAVGAGGAPPGETKAAVVPPAVAPPAAEGGTAPVGGVAAPAGEGQPAQAPPGETAEGEVQPEETVPEEEVETEAAPSSGETGGAQVAGAQPGEASAPGSQPASPPAESTQEVEQPMAAVPAPFLTGPGASATLPEPLSASNLIGSAPAVVEARGRLRIRVF